MSQLLRFNGTEWVTPAVSRDDGVNLVDAELKSVDDQGQWDSVLGTGDNWTDWTTNPLEYGTGVFPSDWVLGRGTAEIVADAASIYGGQLLVVQSDPLRMGWLNAPGDTSNVEILALLNQPDASSTNHQFGSGLSVTTDENPQLDLAFITNSQINIATPRIVRQYWRASGDSGWSGLFDFAHEAGDWIWVRNHFDEQPSNELRMRSRAWHHGASEPSLWMGSYQVAQPTSGPWVLPFMYSENSGGKCDFFSFATGGDTAPGPWDVGL